MKMVFASHNQGKIQEVKELLSDLDVEIVTLEDLGLNDEIEENGESFLENAKIKAQTVLRVIDLPVLADDSGLCVYALGGAPGVFSARFGGEGLSDEERSDYLVRLMRDRNNRGAMFVCTLLLTFPDDETPDIDITEECKGEIGHEARGTDGFGYDPIFYVGEKSFAELGMKEKNEISHRGKAMRRLKEEIKKIIENQK